MTNTASKNKTNEKVKVYANFTKKEREALIRYVLWQYEKSKEEKVKDLTLVGFLGFDTAFPIFSRVFTIEKKANGKKVKIEKMQSMESTLEEMAVFLKPNFRNDRLYKISINMVDYVSIKWGFLRICSCRTTSKRKRTELMNQLREYFLNSAGCYPALKWKDNEYLVLGIKTPEKKAIRYINKNEKLKEEYSKTENKNPVDFLKEIYNAYQGYYDRPYGLHLLMILDGNFIFSSKKNYDEAALEYIRSDMKLYTKYLKQKEINKLQPAQFLLKNYNTIKIDYFIAPQAEEDNFKKFDVIDSQHVPTAQIAIKQFTDKEFITFAWLLFFYVKGYILSNQNFNKEFNDLFCEKKR